MSLAKKCSRCGKFYEHYYPKNKLEWNGVQRIYVTNMGIIHKTHSALDFCPECMSEFDKFMINGGKFDD